MKRNKLFYGLGALALLMVLIVISWVTVETGIEISSHADFCGTCHVMEPMVNSYHDSIHGGNNPRGIMAACTDCHTSHENVVSHFASKAQSGTHDVWVTLTRDESTLDWQAKREEHNNYVYDSGCLTCHRKLEEATRDKGFHDKYFSGDIDSQCVDCHAEVGHDNLNKYLLETKYKYHFDE